MAARRQPAVPGAHLIREAEAISAGAVAVFLALSFLSFSPDAPHPNLGGPVGHALAGTALRALGVAAYLFPLYLGYFTVALLRRGAEGFGGLRLVGAALLVASIAALAGLVTGGRAVVRGGGWLGGFAGVALRDLLGGPGAFLLLAVVLVVALVLATGVSAVEASGRAARWLAATVRAGAARLGRRPGAADEPSAVPRRPKLPVLLDDALEPPPEAPADNPPPIIREPERRPEASRRARRSELQEELFAEDSYRLPALNLLDPPVRTTQPLDESALHANSRILETKLADFQVIGKVVAVRPGPVITTFEFEPAPGVKVNRTVTLAHDLSMALRALSVRVLAPIPGKPVVGIEVSNPRREKVFIRELLESVEYEHAESKLALALGKDTTGNVVVADLARMPHLLVAGATGTGKSVSMNAMVMSILYKSSPRDVRFIMIDPKMLELSIYENREIEESITRLAQKARAAGIHLILAIQRPSVDVITGLIKANFPARISFQVTSRTDSRTILDAIGAERLLGEGDMLFLPPGTARVQRLHGAFVSDGDVHRVVDFIKRQEEPRYEMELLEGGDDEEGEGEDGEDLTDEMYDMAVRLVTEQRQASISWLQRRLRVGYNRAARMIERMEREGVVSSPGAKGREVIARRIEE